MRNFEPLSDLQWEKLKVLFPEPLEKRPGKPHVCWRTLLNAVLYVLFTNEKWGAWPQTSDYATKSSAHRWYLKWSRTGFLDQIIEIAKDFNPENQIVVPPKRNYSLKEIERFEQHKARAPLFKCIETDNPALVAQ